MARPPNHSTPHPNPPRKDPRRTPCSKPIALAQTIRLGRSAPEQGFVCFLIQLIFPRNLARPTQFPYITNHTIDARSSVTKPTVNRQSRKQRKSPLPGFPEPHSTRLPIDRDVASGIRIVCPNATPYVTPYWHVRSYPRAHSFVSLDYFAMRECEKQTPLVYRSMMTGYFVMYIENLLS